MKRMNAKNNAYKPSEIKIIKTKGKERIVKIDKFLSPIVNTNNIQKHAVKDAEYKNPGDKTVTLKISVE